jgi:hypothetical protein
MSGEPVITVWAQAAKPNDVFRSVEFLVTVGVLSAILLGGAVVLYFTDIWRKRQLGDDAPSSAESMTSFRALYERGEITEAEYRHIRDKLAAKMKQEIGHAPLPPPAGPATGANPGSDAADAPPPPPDG